MSAEEDAAREAERAAAERIARDARRAAQYADEAASAVHQAGLSLNNAMHLATEAGEMLARGRATADDLSARGVQVSDSDNPRRVLLEAEVDSTTVAHRASSSNEILGELRGQLDRTQDALRTGRRAVDQISRLPGERHELVDPLKDRLDNLEDAVRYADQRATEVAGKLAVAQGNVEPLVQQTRSFGELRATGETLRSTGQQAGSNLADAKDGLDSVGRQLQETGPGLSQAQRESAELERSLRAAANPTPVEKQKAPGSAAEEGTFRLNPGEITQRGYDR